MSERETSDGMHWMIGLIREFWIVFPCINEEAIETAKTREEKRGGQQGNAQFRSPGNRRDEDRSSKEDADRNLFREAVSAASDMNQYEISK